MKNLIIILSISFIFSCASNPINLAPQNYSSSSKNGLIVGTISIIDGRPKYNSYDFFYRELKQQKKHRITIKPDQGGFTMVLKPDYSIGDTLVFQYIVEHSPGQYEFFNYSLFNNMGYVQTTKREKKGFSIPFKVESGQIAYLGDMVINTKEFKKTGTLVKWIDNSNRELIKFNTKFKNIDWSTFTNQTITEGEVENKKLIEFQKAKR
jgi:hypothetical protein